MMKLNELKNTSKLKKPRKRIGRGIGSGTGKTSGRGTKGAGARAGWKQRLGYEGGQMRFFMKLPERGFSNVRFEEKFETINLGQIETMFNDGDTVTRETLKDRGFIRSNRKIKILGKGELSKQVKIEANAISAGARDKLQKAKISFTLIEKWEKQLNNS
jgi:large subunit ribosomal protein L15